MTKIVTVTEIANKILTVIIPSRILIVSGTAILASVAASRATASWR